jgi:hypothetical protein
MSKKLHLQIPTPCHENWENMTQVDKGRFCTSCEKNVIDFSNMSDREIAMFFKKSPTGSVCGRFIEDQLDRDIEIPRKRIPWVKYFFQFLLPGFLLSTKATAQGKRKIVEKNFITNKLSTPPFKGALSSIKGIKTDNDCRSSSVFIIVGQTISPALQKAEPKKILITGKVIDHRGNPVPYATVIIKGTKKAVAADSTGMFSINPATNWKNITLSVSSVGFEPSEINLDRSGPVKNLEIQLKQTGTLGEVIVSSTNTYKLGMVSGSITIQSYSEISKKMLAINFRVYPNPVQSYSTLHIEWSKKEYGDCILHLYNQSGQLVFKKDLFLDQEARILSMDMPLVLPGSYFLKMINKSSGKSYTEKIIIE